MSNRKNISTHNKTLLYFHGLVVVESYSIEYTSELVRQLSEENPHIPSWIFSSSLGAMRGSLDIGFPLDNGELVWVKNPDYRIKYLGSSLAISPHNDEANQDNNHSVLNELFDELVKNNPHQPSWSFNSISIEQFEDRLITAFNEGEIVWIKNPEKRVNFIAEKILAEKEISDFNNRKISLGMKVFLGLWILGLYYTVNVAFKNIYGWEFVIKCGWVLLTFGIVYVSVITDSGTISNKHQ